MRSRKLVLLVGAPRSGTSWLQLMLSAHPAVCSTAELMLFNRFAVPWLHTWQQQVESQRDGVRIGLPVVWTQEELEDFLRTFLDRVYDRVAEAKPEASVVLDKHPGYSLFVDEIRRLKPRAYILHLVRDGRDTAASMIAASRGWGKVWAPGEVRSAARMWRRYFLAARKAEAHDRYLEVRYEDLSRDGAATLGSIFDFLGLEHRREQVEAILADHSIEKVKRRNVDAASIPVAEGVFRRGQVGSWRDELNPRQRYLFDREAGGLLRELGYAGPRWWASSGFHRLTLPALASVPSWSRLQRRLRTAAAVLLGREDSRDGAD